MLRRELLRRGRALASSSSNTSSCSIISQSPSFSSSSLRRPQPLPSSQHFATPLPPRLLGGTQRWLSTASEPKTGGGDTPPPGAESAKPAEENPLQKELEAKNREVIDLKDKYLRSVADFRNLQERTRRDVESARQFAIQRFAADLIESIDNFDRALEAVPQESLDPDAATASSSGDDEDAPTHHKDLLNLHSGLKMTESILMSTLKKHGLERFDPMDGPGRKFDPRLDEATFMTKVEGREDGDVFHTQSKGFTLNGRVLRAAKVGVVKN